MYPHETARLPPVSVIRFESLYLTDVVDKKALSFQFLAEV